VRRLAEVGVRRLLLLLAPPQIVFARGRARQLARRRARQRVPRHELDHAGDAELLADLPMQPLDQQADLRRIGDVALNDHHGNLLVLRAEHEESRRIHRPQLGLPLGCTSAARCGR
jgi:hypothetical protein